MIIERRQQHVEAEVTAVFDVFKSIGGARGYRYAWSGPVRVRGAADRPVGGVGLRRGRRDPTTCRVGDALDFWRVEAVELTACSACARR